MKNDYDVSNNKTEKIKEELKKLPKKPGVYIMHDKKDEIIYVGKAVNLFNRVRSYFRENIGRGPKIDRMVSLIEYFEYIVTDSELEALVLENDLIKEHRPKYNTMLMDDKTYPYIRVTVNEEYPRIMLCRQVKKDKARYFGPYTSGQAVRDVIDLINKIYQLRTCNKKLDIVNDNSNRNDCYAAINGRYCLNYHMKQCMGPCQGQVSVEEYNQRLKGAIDFLSGNFAPIQNQLKSKMLEHSENLEFEEAAKYRDLLESVNAVAQKQKIEDNNLDDKDVIGIAVKDNDAVIEIFFVRNGKMVGREHFHLNVSEEEIADESLTKENLANEKNCKEGISALLITRFIMQFYAGTPYIPRDIYIPNEVDNFDMIESWLTGKRGNRVHLIIPKIGQKERLVELANKNAGIILEQDKEKIKLEEARTIGAVHEIEDWLGLAGLERMEAFDISNISGFENVASMVVFEKGKAKKSDYRKFKIKTVAGPDDYACMKEALTRRFLHGLDDIKRMSKDNNEGLDNYQEQIKTGFAKLPDLLLMDGGRGQVNIALEVLNELHINIPVAGMVKDDNHHTRGLYFNNIEIPVDTHSEGFKLITRIQDEAHRFAISYHRSLRRKDQVHSVLDDIPGVGPARRQALMKAFSSLEEIKNATVEELADKAGIPANAAESILKFLNSK